MEDVIKELINSIIDKIGNEKYIFRGENRDYKEIKLSSGLYRDFNIDIEKGTKKIDKFNII